MKQRISFRCDTCDFELWRPVARLSVSTLGLYSDGRFPGRSILVLNEHWDHLEKVDDEVALEFFSDLKKAASAIKRTTCAIRMNFAVLGNEVPHVHAHLIPRFPHKEPSPNRTPWEQDLPHVDLPEKDCTRLTRLISLAIGNPRHGLEANESELNA
jgi:diadenosine tetraphosphate (Ap4A) HIT family hydrolase